MAITRKTRDEVIAWAAAHDWMPFGEGKTPDGYPQESYVTPAGNVVFIIYDNEKENYLKTVALPMPPMPMSMPRQNPPFPNIPGQGFPFGRG